MATAERPEIGDPVKSQNILLGVKLVMLQDQLPMLPV